MAHDAALRQHLVSLLTEANAHATFDDAVKDLPAALRGKVPKGAEHSPWQLLEHLRIAQWDILEFSRDAKHKSPDWPGGYWPTAPEPPDEKAWEKSVRAFHKDLKAMCDLISRPGDRSLREDSSRRRADDSARSAADRRPQCLPRRPACAGAAAARRVEVGAGSLGADRIVVVQITGLLHPWSLRQGGRGTRGTVIHGWAWFGKIARIGGDLPYRPEQR